MFQYPFLCMHFRAAYSHPAHQTYCCPIGADNLELLSLSVLQTAVRRSRVMPKWFPLLGLDKSAQVISMCPADSSWTAVSHCQTVSFQVCTHCSIHYLLSLCFCWESPSAW